MPSFTKYSTRFRYFILDMINALLPCQVDSICIGLKICGFNLFNVLIIYFYLKFFSVLVLSFFFVLFCFCFCFFHFKENYLLCFSCNISNTRRCLSSDIQTLRSRLKKRGAAEFF